MKNYSNDYTPEIGDRVEPAEGVCSAADFEQGRVVKIDGEWLTIAWDSGVRTDIDPSGLVYVDR